MTHVAIVIVAFNNPGDVVACVAALGDATHRQFEILVCENGGAAAAMRLREQLADCAHAPPVQIIAADNPGFAGGVNLGMAATPDADAWWILNPDTVPDATALAELVARLDVGDVDAVGGVVCFRDGSVQGAGGVWRGWLARAESLRDRFASDDAGQARAIEARQDYLLGAAMLVSRRFLAATGPMREDYFLYAEEVEWCVRAVAAGMKLGHAPTARIVHHHGTTTGAGGDVRTRPRLPVYLDERNRLLVVRDTRPWRLPVAVVAMVAVMMLRYGRAGAFRQLGFALQGWLAGLRNERGRPGWMV